MSEFEYFEMQNMAYSGIPISASIFIYLVFAYIVASYLAGDKFPRFIAVSASIVYTLALIGPLAGVTTNLLQSAVVYEEYKSAFPDGALLRSDLGSNFSLIVSLSPLIIGWLASIMFLHLYVRKPEVKNRDDDT